MCCVCTAFLILPSHVVRLLFYERLLFCLERNEDFWWSKRRDEGALPIFIFGLNHKIQNTEKAARRESTTSDMGL